MHSIVCVPLIILFKNLFYVFPIWACKVISLHVYKFWVFLGDLVGYPKGVIRPGVSVIVLVTSVPVM